MRSVDTGVSVGGRLRAGRQKYRGSNPRQGKMIFFSPKHADQLWAPPSLLLDGNWGLFFLGHNDRFVKKSTRIRLVPNLRVSEPTILPFF